MKYFTIDELTHSNTATQRGINNNPPPEALESLSKLIEEFLDPLREAWGKPIRVNSGYRCPRLNKLIGGAKNSQHLLGQAVDITSDDNAGLFELIRQRGGYDQLIWEHGDRHAPQWIHVSYRRGHNRGQTLKTLKMNGRTVYAEF